MSKVIWIETWTLGVLVVLVYAVLLLEWWSDRKAGRTTRGLFGWLWWRSRHI